MMLRGDIYHLNNVCSLLYVDLNAGKVIYMLIASQ